MTLRDLICHMTFDFLVDLAQTFRDHLGSRDVGIRATGNVL